MIGSDTHDAVRRLSEENARLQRELSEREAEVARLSDALWELAALKRTRTFRYTERLRRLYARARARRAGGRRDPESEREKVRRELAAAYLRGDGIEIGPLQSPLPLPPAASVRYVDRMGIEGLRRQYPELAGFHFVTPDVIDDGETLATFDDASLDFVVANHFIEHCENPIAAIENALRVLRDGGIVYMAVPDKRTMFDAGRPVTGVEHVLRDYREGPGWSRREHFVEFARLVDHAEDPEAHADELMGRDFSIHYHVWTPGAFASLLEHCREALALPFEVVDVRPNGVEFIALLKRQARG